MRTKGWLDKCISKLFMLQQPESPDVFKGWIFCYIILDLSSTEVHSVFFSFVQAVLRIHKSPQSVCVSG
jgi:hypothetical protein